MRGRRTEKKMAARIWHACMVNGAVDAAHLETALEMVLDQKPIGWHGIAHELVRRWRLDLAQRTAHVACAASLFPSTETQVEQWLKRRYPAVTTVCFNTDPGLIGGLCIRVGSDVIDDSVSGRLAEIRRQFQRSAETVQS